VESIELTMVLVAGLALAVGWVLSDLLDEQLIGSVRRAPRPMPKAAPPRSRARTPVATATRLPPAVARPRSRSVVAPRPGS